MNSNLWIFGYGSLIFPKGINGRGMKHHYTEEDLIPATLKHYHREWNAVWHNMRFLGCIPNHNSWMNGIIFPITIHDIQHLLESEGSAPTEKNPLYRLESVKPNIQCNHQFNTEDRILTCVTANPILKGNIPPEYIDLIEEGLKHRGHEFTQTFKQTTIPH